MSSFGTTDTDDDNSGSSFSSRTVAWILIPLIIIIFIGLTATIIQVRRRRQRRQHAWFGTSDTMRTVTPSGRVIIVRRGRNGTGPETRRLEEGFNELGEAPPPYEPKKDIERDSTELQHVESGDPSPAYPAEPSPVVARETTRHV